MLDVHHVASAAAAAEPSSLVSTSNLPFILIIATLFTSTQTMEVKGALSVKNS